MHDLLRNKEGFWLVFGSLSVNTSINFSELVTMIYEFGDLDEITLELLPIQKNPGTQCEMNIDRSNMAWLWQ